MWAASHLSWWDCRTWLYFWKKVILKLCELLFLYASKNYPLGIKKTQYYSLCNIFENTPALQRFCLGHFLFSLVDKKCFSLWQYPLVQVCLSTITKFLTVVWVLVSSLNQVIKRSLGGYFLTRAHLQHCSKRRSAQKKSDHQDRKLCGLHMLHRKESATVNRFPA